jgi:polyadenylate-binding protein
MGDDARELDEVVVPSTTVAPITDIQDVKLPGNVFVAGLPPEMDDVEFERLFAPYGHILSAKIMLDVNTGLSRGFGFVMFGTSQVDGKRRTGAESESLAVQEMNGKPVGASHVLTVQKSLHDGRQALIASNVVYVRNLPRTVDEQQVSQFFQQFGTVVSCTVRPDNTFHNTGKGTCNLASVVFTTVDAAREAIKAAHGKRGILGSSTTVLAKFGDTPESRELKKTRKRSTPQPPSAPPLSIIPTVAQVRSPTFVVPAVNTPTVLRSATMPQSQQPRVFVHSPQLISTSTPFGPSTSVPIAHQPQPVYLMPQLMPPHSVYYILPA